MSSNLNVVDLQEKYTGLELLAHITSKFYSLMSKATLQVFQCLAKGTHTEVKKIVNPALDILLPAWITTPEEQVGSSRSRFAVVFMGVPYILFSSLFFSRKS